MASDLDILEEMIRKPPLERHRFKRGKNEVTLKEEKGNYSVAISGMPSDCIIIDADSFEVFWTNEKNNGYTGTIIEGGKGAARRPDYIIICESNNQKRILYVELKGEKPKNKEVREKLKASKCFMKYIRKLGKEFWGKPNFLAHKEYTSHYVLIERITGRKPTYKNHSKGTGVSPDEFLRIMRGGTSKFSDLLNSNPQPS